MRVRPLATLLIAGSVLFSACSSFDGSSPDTTTGTVDPGETTTTTTAPTTSSAPSTTAVPEGSGLGLWVSSPAGITDESGETWASPGPGEMLVDPVDDASGGVFYLRCGAQPGRCGIEHQTAVGGTAAVIGEAQRLMALGSLGQKQVLLTVWQDPSVTPSIEQDTSGQFARVVDVESGEVVGTYAWFGWNRGPFVADVEQDRFAVCTGEGEACELTTFDGAAGPPVPVPGVARAQVSSLVVDGEARTVTWVTTTPATGEVAAHQYDVTAGAVVDLPILGAGSPGPDEVDTDGSWVAVRTGGKVAAYELTDAGSPGTPPTPAEELEVPADTTQIALRPSGASSGVASSL